MTGCEDGDDDPYAGRRQLDTLTACELRAQPAWWCPGAGRTLGGPDEATVVPIDASAATADGSIVFPEGRYLLHAVFTLADGTRLDGHVTFAGGGPDGAPGDDGSLAAREPTICTPRGQVPLWHGALPRTAADLAADLAKIGRPREAVFPLRWTATLHPPGVALSGTIER